MKTFIVRRPRKESEEIYGKGDLILEIEERELDFYIQNGWKADTQREAHRVCCEPCELGCACDENACPCKK